MPLSTYHFWSNWNLELFFFFRGKGKAEEILTSRSKGKLSTISTHVWRRRRDLNPAHIGGRRVLWHHHLVSVFFFFVLSSVFFLFFCSLFLEIGRNASRSCNHLSTYILIVGFHGSNHMLIVRTELSSVSCVVLERVSIGEEKCDVTLPWQQNFWITTMGDLGGTTVTATSTAKKQ